MSRLTSEIHPGLPVFSFVNKTLGAFTLCFCYASLIYCAPSDSLCCKLLESSTVNLAGPECAFDTVHVCFVITPPGTT